MQLINNYCGVKWLSYVQWWLRLFNEILGKSRALICRVNLARPTQADAAATCTSVHMYPLSFVAAGDRLSYQLLFQT